MDFESAEQLRIFLTERFGIHLPKEILLKNTKSHGIRVHSLKSGSSEHIYGLEGFMACSKNSGLSQYFFQLIGHLAQKNVIALNKKDTIACISGEQIKKSLTSTPGLVILTYKGHILGYGVLEGKGSIRYPVREKQKREINNEIAGYPGRNL
ncbi:MAG: hypothetical protein WCT31_01945 [Candidatus Micrarchaeia archaeon]